MYISLELFAQTLNAHTVNLSILQLKRKTEKKVFYNLNQLYIYPPRRVLLYIILERKKEKKKQKVFCLKLKNFFLNGGTRMCMKMCLQLFLANICLF